MGGRDQRRLYGADVILLLDSPDSLDSDYFTAKSKVSLSAMQRRSGGGAGHLAPALWEDTPIALKRGHKPNR
ncbi:MAG: hypothetical protein IPN33_26665 [Saprospiraceae bacterium]|nr:hypothetical protein [Saprospiraceae bacterium]